tara:strand:- start:9881 stop:10063 length:183 start_codon:yes stop_codon:yes gene_type:complete
VKVSKAVALLDVSIISLYDSPITRFFIGSTEVTDSLTESEKIALLTQVEDEDTLPQEASA